MAVKADPSAAAADGAAAAAPAAAPASAGSSADVWPPVSSDGGSFLLNQGRELYGYDVVMPDAKVPTNTTNYMCIKASNA
jgi:hypothetical protein